MLFFVTKSPERVEGVILLAACLLVFAGCWLVPLQVGCAAGSCFLGNSAGALKIGNLLFDTAALEA